MTYIQHDSAVTGSLSEGEVVHWRPTSLLPNNLARQQYIYASVPRLHCKKKVSRFPVPSRDVTNQTLPGLEKLNYSRLGRVWLVTSLLGRGKRLTFFTVYTVNKGYREFG
jgi:hypothetical protein